LDKGGWAKFLVSILLSILVLGTFSAPLGSFPPLGSLLDPTTGLWSVGFGARHPATAVVRVPGLSGEVMILRDVRGVPHVYASTDADGWFGIGYAHAQDRLWQMDIQYRAAAGRLSEVLGADFVSTDTFFRTIGLARIAATNLAERRSANGIDVRILDAYTAGVNAYIASLDPPDYPLEFKLLGYAPEPWSAEKSMTEGALIAWGLAGAFYDLEYNLGLQKFQAKYGEVLGQQYLEELFPAYPAGPQVPIQTRAAGEPVRPLVSAAAAEDILRKARAAHALVPDFQGAGSNNWAIRGNRTETGKPLLAADPHLSFQLPAVWYWAELQAGAFHVRGATFPGIPGFFFGTNGHVAWGETNTGADVNDFYVETISPDNRSYLFQGAWYDLNVREEPIRVKGGTVVSLVVRETRHGPILTEKGQTVAMQSTIRYFGQELSAILGFNLATNSEEFNASARLWRVPAQNIIYADADGPYGNIGIRSTGLFPIRQGFDGRLPLNGSSGLFEWSGWVPFDAYPHLFNPPEGFVASANQVPAPSGYPYLSSLGSFFDPGYRARRIHALLASDDMVSLEDLRRFQQDVGEVAAASLVPYLLQAVVPSDGVAQAAIDAFRNWSFTMTTDSVAATIWATFMDKYIELTFGDEYRAADATDLSLPQFNTLEDLTVRAPASHWFDNVTTPAVETRDDILREAFEATVDDLTVRLGPVVASWTWGSVHVRQFDHLSALSALARGPFPSPGDGFTLNVAGGLVARHGPSWRMLLDFSNLDNSLAIYPGGQSGSPLSVHYDDFLQTYMEGGYFSFAGAPAPSAIPAEAVESNLRLEPG